MMQPTEDRVSYNLKVAWNAMPMLLWWNRKTGRRIRNSWADAGVGPAMIVMLDPFFQNIAQVVLC